MNIIKLKDKIMPDSLPQAEYFNTNLKGKYAYWIRMTYIVSFDEITENEYKVYESNDDTSPLPIHFNSSDLFDYIDVDETVSINSINDFIIKNTFTTDDNITIDELKLFRTWLAKQLLHMSSNTTDSKTLHILNYYANEMYDDTVKILSDFGSIPTSLNTINTSSCGCRDSNISSLYNTELNVCNVVSIYRKNIYNKMVAMFSTISYWEKWSPEFINEFKKYIDNIIKCNFILTPNQWYSEFADCSCQNKSEQEKYIEILKRLSTSLGYIRDKQISGHKNYIMDALYDWSSILYEKMCW